MPVTLSWGLVAPPAPSAGATAAAPVQEQAAPARQKRGLQMPLRLGPRDLATATGDDLLMGKVTFLFLQEGGMPWRPELRIGLDRMRNKNDLGSIGAFGGVYAGRVVSRWLRNVRVVAAKATSDGTVKTLSVELKRTDTTNGSTNLPRVAVVLPSSTI